MKLFVFVRFFLHELRVSAVLMPVGKYLNRSGPRFPKASLANVDRTIDEFKSAFNNHSISSEGNRFPVQLFTLDRRLLLLNYPE